MKRSGPIQRRTPLARGAGPKRSGNLRPVSKKRQAANRERRQNLHDRYGPNPLCHACPIYAEAGIVTGCDGRADDGHEVLTRARGGSITDPDGILPVGRRCHERIDAEQDEAVRLGLLRHSWDT